MDKAKTLELIQNAKKAHEAQMHKIEVAIDGEKGCSHKILAKTKSGLGKCLYNENNHLYNILGSLFYDKLDVLFSKWYSEYLRVHEILYREEKKGLFSKMRTSKVSAMDIDRAKLYYSELEVTTKELFKAMDSSQRRLGALQESKFY